MGRMPSTLYLSAAALCLAAAGLLSLGGGCKEKDTGAGDPATAHQKKEFGELLPFHPGEWQTNEDFEPSGDPRAKKGGTLLWTMATFPPTLRQEGPNSNLTTLSYIGGMVYESLLGRHPNTLEFIPGLATHWQVSEDKRTFRFRIDPRARWADGSEVTAEDVLWSWWHRVQEDRKEPILPKIYGKFEKPVVEDKYTISVRSKELNWRCFEYFAFMSIYPAKQIRVPGDRYLEEYQWKMVMGSGPYEIKEENIKKEQHLILTRRQDYWAADHKANVGQNNFDEIKIVIVRERELEWEKFKKGDLDVFFVGKAQRWFTECDFDKIKNGWIQKRKIFNDAPIGFSGYVFNMRKPPFDDIRVRKAFAHLVNRAKLMDKLFYNEYQYTDSIYPGSQWENPDNPKVRYNPELAQRLLAEAGWSERNEEGWLTKDGKPFELTLEYGWPTWTRIHATIKEYIEEAGIKLELKQVDWRTILKKIEERNFTIHFQGWGAILWPNPETMWASDLADKKTNNNIPGFKNERVDELCEQYKTAFEIPERVKILREIDGIVCREYPYAFSWHSGFSRPLYWAKFGHPEEYWPRISGGVAIWSYWWIDPEKEKELEKAMADGTKLPVGDTVQKPWENYEMPKDK